MINLRIHSDGRRYLIDTRNGKEHGPYRSSDAMIRAMHGIEAKQRKLREKKLRAKLLDKRAVVS
jgi:hypothetical protein